MTPRVFKRLEKYVEPSSGGHIGFKTLEETWCDGNYIFILHFLLY